MVINNKSKLFFIYFILVFLTVGLAQETQVVALEEDSLKIKDELAHFELDQIIENLKVKALKRYFPTTIENSLITEDSQENLKFTTSSKGKTISTTIGVWVKDITPPEITYTRKGEEKWITVKVHGYVAKKPNKTEARELLKKQLSAKPLMEDVQVHSIEYYPNDFVVSIVVLDSTNYKSHSEMNRIANILAKRQVLTYFQGSNIEEVFIYKTNADGKFTIVKDEYAQNTYSAVKESSSGWVNAIESLDKVLIKGTNEWTYIFFKEIVK